MESLRVTDARVAAAVARVRRADFLPPAARFLAGHDGPLAIGYGQTTSQPSLIAWMLDQLALRPGAKVLEVGTGCGYQTALLAELAGRVFSVDIVEPLAREAAERLAQLGYRNVTVRCGDGYLGWPEEAPFDAILVAAGAERVPPPLVEQLAPGGRLLIPLGAGEAQTLELVTRDTQGAVRGQALLGVRFVPLTGAPAEADRRGWR